MKRILSLCAALAATLPAHAGPADATANVRARDVVSAEVLPGWRTAQGTHMAALRLRLADQWKTYWRAPGEAGIPPSFDWSGSDNLQAVQVHWPQPTVFDLNGLRTLGYTRELVLPIEFTPQSPDAPMALVTRIELGLCRDVCMPVTLELDALLSAAGGPRDTAITAALAARPQTAQEAGLKAIRCRVEPIHDGLRLTAQIEIPDLGGSEMAVFELGDPDIWVSEAQSQRQGRHLTAVAELVPPSGAPFALDRSSVRITLLGEKGAVDLRGCPAG